MTEELQLVLHYTIIIISIIKSMIITNVEQAVDIILNQEPLIIFQGESEWGPRALGNRSIIFDPRNPDAQTIINEYKKREWWRPFAGSILLEKADEWFYMGSLKESRYMSFAIQAKEIAIHTIPAIIHKGTCRIQTVSKEQNIHFYNLINTFYNKTGVPILLNTSLNLAGDPIAETFEDAVSITERSNIKYIYYPESNEKT